MERPALTAGQQLDHRETVPQIGLQSHRPDLTASELYRPRVQLDDVHAPTVELGAQGLMEVPSSFDADAKRLSAPLLLRALERTQEPIRARPSQLKLDRITDDFAVMISDHRQRRALPDIDRHDQTTSRIQTTDTIGIASLRHATNELRHSRDLLIGTDPLTPTRTAASDGDPL
jgi:hypothetical protein